MSSDNESNIELPPALDNDAQVDNILNGIVQNINAIYLAHDYLQRLSLNRHQVRRLLRLNNQLIKTMTALIG